jgi:hypothetical protein
VVTGQATHLRLYPIVERGEAEAEVEVEQEEVEVVAVWELAQPD